MKGGKAAAGRSRPYLCHAGARDEAEARTERSDGQKRCLQHLKMACQNLFPPTLSRGRARP